jgi:hypothetical protein
MSEKNETSYAAWIAALAAVASAIAAVFMGFNARGSSLSAATWPLLSGIEAVIIGILAVYLARRPLLALPRGLRVQNRHMVESLFRSVSRGVDEQLRELRSSRISLYGRHVLNAQVSLMEATSEHKDGRIRATDIVLRLDLWPKRTAYLRANESFLKAGGTIERIFIISSDLLTSDDDAKRLGSILEMHAAMGVKVGLQFSDVLRHEDIEDFIVYANDCVLLEVEQADVNFATGKATVFFDADSVRKYRGKFETLQNATDRDYKAARAVLDMFNSFMAKPTVGKTFADRKIELLRAVR